MPESEKKTPDYTRRAIDKYNAKFDKVQFNIDKGEKEKWKAAGLDNNEIIRIIRAEYKKRTESDNPMPEPVKEEKQKKFKSSDFDY